MLRALLFDFDGTIAQSEPLHYAAFAEVLARRGIVLDELLYYQRYLALTDRECVGRMIEDFDRPDLRSDAARLLREKSDAVATRLARGVPLCPGVEEFVTAAAEHAALAIVSGALRNEIAPVLARSGLERFFPVIVSAEDVRAGKPHPECYRLGVERLRRRGLPDLDAGQCLAFEDAPRGIAAARAAGIRVVALPHSFHAAALRDADLVYPSYGVVEWRALEALLA
jgi:HAD superfamily hydrolase (TIGR01509 family)